jgi:glucan biosynthesis protein C
MNQRRYDIDALRSIAMFLLIFYHLGQSFTYNARNILFVQDKRPVDDIWIILNLLNSWRIPLVFLIAGIALRLSFSKRTQTKILKERLKVLGIPWIFGSLVFASSSAYINGKFYGYPFFNELSKLIPFVFEYNGLHMWFVLYILIFCLITIPFLKIISNTNEKDTIFSKTLKKPGGIFLFAIPVILEGQLLNELRFDFKIDYGDFYQVFANTSHGFVLGFIWFLLGIVLTSQGDAFWESCKRNWKVHLSLGLLSYIYRLLNGFESGFALDNRLIAFESFNFIFLMLGLGAVYLNKDSPQLTYYKTAVYPVYIVHLPVQMAIMYYFAGVNIHPIIKFPIALFLICFLSLTIYHSIKNIKPLRPLFGLRNK